MQGLFQKVAIGLIYGDFWRGFFFPGPWITVDVTDVRGKNPAWPCNGLASQARRKKRGVPGSFVYATDTGLTFSYVARLTLDLDDNL